MQVLETAQIQLSDILLYTEREWGEEQRMLYSRRLIDIMGMLADTPDIGRRRDDLSAGLRSYPVDSHVIYYWHEGGVLFIAHSSPAPERAPGHHGVTTLSPAR